MTIEGSLETMPALDVLEWIRSRGRVGRLAVRNGPILRTLETDGENVTWVSSNRPDDVLSQVLRARGLIDEGSLERAANVEVESGVMLGQALIASGVLDEQQVRAVLDSQIREAVLDMLSWNRGGFRFVPERSDRRDRLNVIVAIDELLVLGRALSTDWAQLREIAPTLETKFWNKAELGSSRHPDSAEAKERHQWLVERIEAGASFGMLIAEATAERFATTADIAVLVGRGIIGVVPQAPGRPMVAAAIETAARAREAQAAGDHQEAVRLARLARDADRTSPEIGRLVAEAEAFQTATLARELLSSHRIPRRVLPPSDVELSAHQRYALERVDGVWDLFSLISSSALGELATLVTYKQLDELGLIAL